MSTVQQMLHRRSCEAKTRVAVSGACRRLGNGYGKQFLIGFEKCRQPLFLRQFDETISKMLPY
jgi:hypothetical protein